MPDLIPFQAQICLTSTAFLVHDQQILLVKHKKLGIWLAPGGHLEPNELPHLAAERECFEETGIKVRVFSVQPDLQGQVSQYLPIPFVVNLHWISESNYHTRIKSHKPHGCEQHLVFCYLVKPITSLQLVQNQTETDALNWFTEKEIVTLETTPDIKQEIKLAFTLFYRSDL